MNILDSQRQKIISKDTGNTNPGVFEKLRYNVCVCVFCVCMCIKRSHAE